MFLSRSLSPEGKSSMIVQHERLSIHPISRLPCQREPLAGTSCMLRYGILSLYALWSCKETPLVKTTIMIN